MSNEVKVTSRSSQTIHLGYSASLTGTGAYRAMCGQRGNFGKTNTAQPINCAKCQAAHGQGSAALAAAKA